MLTTREKAERVRDAWVKAVRGKGDAIDSWIACVGEMEKIVAEENAP